MGTAFSVDGKNVMLTGIGAVAGYISAHTADPGANGASEVSGGSPAYARKAITWGAAAEGSMVSSNAPVLDIPAGTTVSWLGLWSAASGGTFYGAANVTDELFAGQGTYTVTAATLSVTDPA